MTSHESTGFEITLHDAKHIVRVRTWGCWDRDLVKTYGNALGEKLDEIRETGEEWWILVDVTALHPQTEDVERMLCEQIQTASQSGITKIACLGTGAAVQVRVNRRFQKAGVPQCAFFETQEGAVQWLLSDCA